MQGVKTYLVGDLMQRSVSESLFLANARAFSRCRRRIATLCSRVSACINCSQRSASPVSAITLTYLNNTQRNKYVLIRKTKPMPVCLESDHAPYCAFQRLSLIHISEPTRRTPISYAVFC